MRILLTGASSFTGLWFAKTLAEAGHHVVAPLPRARGAYEGLRAQRVEMLSKVADIVWSCRFGDDAFMSLIASGSWDRFCQHAAQVGDYKSPAFDVAAALQANINRLPDVLRSMQERGMSGVVLTGSVFEAHEGAGSEPLCAFSPYGLSKGLTAEAFAYYCANAKVPLSKFVIPNPFGPFEEPRFCTYLLRCWKDGKTAAVKTPAYVRDNIHVSLLSLCYKAAVEASHEQVFRRVNPSGYVETQGAFAQRFAREIGTRLNLACALELSEQTEFPEPAVRINTQIPDHRFLNWNETAAWDELAAYYKSAA